MAIAKGTNSYADVSEADAYFEDRLDAASWKEATPEMKEQALVTATLYMNDMAWVGTAVSASQPLAFPREGSYFDPLVGAEVTLTSTVPDRVVKATLELALHLLSNQNLFEDTGVVRNLSVGPISISGIISPNKVPTFVRSKIKPLLINSGATTWWRAN